MSEFFVYIHRRLTDGEVFYVGKGKGERYKTKSGRNVYWHRVAQKHGWVAQKVFSNLTEPCAHNIEKILIYAMRHKLVNVTDGGEGVCGLRHTKETKIKMVQNRKPGWIPFWTGKTMPDDLKEKFRIAKIGKKQSPEHAAKSRIAKLGKTQPESAREIIRALKSKAIRSSDGVTYRSAAEAARMLSIKLGCNASQGNISMCANGHRHLAYGLKWEYLA